MAQHDRPSEPDYVRLQERLDDLEMRGLRRHLRSIQMTSPTEGLLGTQHVDVFSSNDYLGLAQHPVVKRAWAGSGAGAGSARLIAGDRALHRALEERLSVLHDCPVTLFSSGWHANLALYTTLLRPEDTVASDELNHASTIDALRLSGATKVILPHGTTTPPAGARLLATEGLFSMDGDVPNLRAAFHSCQTEGVWLAVDEAHSVGALGPDGRGSASAQGVTPDFLMGTLGKAFGAFGAYVAGPAVLRDLFISSARTFIFTTGLPEPACAAALAALSLADDDRRARLAENVVRLRTGLAQLGIEALGSDHVVPIVLGSRTMSIATELLKAGFMIPGIRPPTVPAGKERLRVSLSAAHSADQIDSLLDTLAALCLPHDHR